MQAKAFIRVAVAIVACAAIIVGSMVAPEFAYCATPSDVTIPGFDSYLACDHSVGESMYTTAILLLAEISVALIAARSAASRIVSAGLVASASSTFLALFILQIMFDLPLKSVFDVSAVVACVVAAAIGAATAWASGKWWPVEPRNR